MIKRVLYAVFGLVAVAWSHVALAEIVHFSTTLSGANEVPPVPSSGVGTAELRLDTTTRDFTYTIRFSGLTAALSASHFHGPVGRGGNASILVPIPLPNAREGMLSGTVTLNEGQMAQVLAGQWYINLHTPNFPTGEIRGQIERR
jgi:hypothetical protein